MKAMTILLPSAHYSSKTSRKCRYVFCSRWSATPYNDIYPHALFVEKTVIMNIRYYTFSLPSRDVQNGYLDKLEFMEDDKKLLIT